MQGVPGRGHGFVLFPSLGDGAGSVAANHLLHLTEGIHYSQNEP